MPNTYEQSLVYNQGDYLSTQWKKALRGPGIDQPWVKLGRHDGCIPARPEGSSLACVGSRGDELVLGDFPGSVNIREEGLSI